jgi:tetratricopeptide (TPR) repeat protein
VPSEPTSRSTPIILVAGAELGPRLGRYEIGALIGKGGMGAVYHAVDPQLGRPVAIKVLGRDVADGAERLIAEAQAMAKLAHPNVVTVYEAGVADGHVFIAMELVRGPTARALLDRPRPWREVLETYLAAGEGLAAAHRAGIVHRDFKPDNILLGEDGRARVSDFGLASGTGGGSAPGDDPGLEDTLAYSALASGTPAYMAPEQHRREAVDARADQFAFCVALHEALYGVRPFAGATVAELRRNVLDHVIVPPTGERRVPSWLRAIVLRGLDEAPARRFRSMDELTAALRRDPAVGRRRLAVAATLVATSGLAAFGLLRPRDAPACEGAPGRVAALWNPGVRGAVHGQLLATGRPYAEATFERVAGTLDRYAGAWSRAHRDACEATAVRHEQSPALLDQRMRCLDRDLGAFGALAGVLADRSSAVALDRAIGASSNLPELERCADADALGAAAPWPDEAARRAQLIALRPRIDQAQALYRLGFLKPALEQARPLGVEVAAIPYAPVRVEVDVLLGRLLYEASDLPAAEKTFREALRAAAEAHDDRGAVEAWIGLLYVVGFRLGRHVEALAMWPGIDEDLVRAGNPAVPRARALTAFSLVQSAAGKVADARASAEEAIAVLEKDHAGEIYMADALLVYTAPLRDLGELEASAKAAHRAAEVYAAALGPEHPSVGRALDMQAVALSFVGRYDEALAVHLRALGDCVRVLGRDHPGCVNHLTNTGETYLAMGRYDEAATYFAEALAVRERRTGPDTPQTADCRTDLAQAKLMLGRLDEALDLQRRAVATIEKVEGADAAHLAGALANLGQILLARGELAPARTAAARALALRERTLGADSMLVSDPLHVLARIALAERKPDEALADAQRAADIRRKVRGARHPDTAQALVVEGEALLALGRAGDAEAPLRDAVAAFEQVQLADPEPLATARLLLARALWAKDRPQALALARSARADLARAGARRRLAEADALLARP